MQHISIISSSVRDDRKSHFVALYFQQYLTENNLATTDIIDLKTYNFPIFEATLLKQDHPSDGVLDFANRIESADGIIIVTPEYNGGYPASLKNAIDLLYDEWYHKPIGLVTVSSGPFGGSQALVSLQFTLWKMKALTIPAMFSVPMVEKAYDANGNALDKPASDKLAYVFITELLHWIKTESDPAIHQAHANSLQIL